jgi:hypothetical protein
MALRRFLTGEILFFGARIYWCIVIIIIIQRESV